jgi:hypothetical protein
MLFSLSLLLVTSVVSCYGDDSAAPGEEVSSRSYRKHETDRDADNLVGAFPALVGTRLDDCQTCHAGKIEGGDLVGSSCDNCHDLLLGATGHSSLETLNGFGRDYLDAGRSREAVKSIEGRDSDGDGFSNGVELSDGRYPGSGLSLPGQAVARTLILSMDEIKAVPSHSQVMLVNNTQQRFDDYVLYKGVKIADLLDVLEIDLSGATGITVIAPDGYMKSIPIDYVMRSFPQPLFYDGLDPETRGASCGFVRYPEHRPTGVSSGSPLPGELRLILGYERNGVPLDPSTLVLPEGKITGEGPFRMVVPQESPGPPDRGSRFSPSDCRDGFDFRAKADHNAGSMVRGVVAIRIDPMQAGVEEFDYMNGGWAYVDAGQLIVYGHGVAEER